jgi:hypothetical protein
MPPVLFISTPLGENFAGGSQSRGECSKLTPPFTISPFYVNEHIGKAIFSTG